MFALIRKFITHFKKTKSQFRGPYRDWDSAFGSGEGWDTKSIYDKTLDAALLVRDGKAIWEQDTVIRENIIYSNLVLAFLLITASQKSDSKRIIDVGGSLATNYFQVKKILGVCIELGGLHIEWHIVERPHFVDAGNKHFKTKIVNFSRTVDEVFSKHSSNTSDTLIFTGSFQYLENPFEYLEPILERGLAVIGFDRILISTGTTHQIYSQHPDKTRYYEASYPVWVISKQKLVEFMSSNGYQLLEQFDMHAVSEFAQAGLLFTKRV